MLRLLVLLLAVFGSVSPSFAQAVNAETRLLLRCGAGFLIAARHDNFEGSDTDRATLREAGTFLMTKGDLQLANIGVTEAERIKLGYDTMAEVDRAIDSDDPSLDGDICIDLVKTERASDAANAATERDKRIDMVMTCGVFISASADTYRLEGKTDEADWLAQISLDQIAAAEDLMGEAGMGEKARSQLGQLYAEDIGTKLQKGEALAYDPATCAGLKF